MFEELRRGLRDAMSRASSPSEGRKVVAMMKQALVDAKVYIADLREATERTRTRLAAERQALETAQRRGRMAADINDAETVRVAREYEQKHGERASVFERKLAAQEEELSLAERELAEMSAQFKSAAAGGAGAGSMPSSGQMDAVAEGAAAEAAAAAEPDAGLKRDIDRAAREARADAMLAELKRRMGK